MTRDLSPAAIDYLARAATRENGDRVVLELCLGLLCLQHREVIELNLRRYRISRQNLMRDGADSTALHDHVIALFERALAAADAPPDDGANPFPL